RQQHLQLLYKMMPRQAIAKLKKGESVVEKYDDVSVYFSDIIGFTSMAGEMTPIQVMAMLNDLYTQFDELVDKYNVYKVETIGGAYMVLGGAPNVCPPAEGAEKVSCLPLSSINTVRNFRKEDGTTVYIRCGIASGPVVAGVVGRAMPRYCLFGDTVNFASRMESTSKRMQIQISELTYYLLRNAPNHKFKMGMRRGPDGSAGVEVKGKGRVMTYWIDGIEEAT
ncbi:guanylate cyclase, partial [Baffinella frigidus]